MRSGELEVIVKGRKVNKIHAGEGFGELALLHDNLRSATIRCVDKVTLWGIDRQMFRKVIEDVFFQKLTISFNFDTIQHFEMAENFSMADK